MSDNDKEKLLDKYPKPVTIECTNIILNQMKECICKIKNKKGKGTGFFCKYNNIKLMITNNHLIDEEILKENNNIIVSINDDKNEKINIKINDKKIYTSIKYDITIIEIKEEKINNYIELDKDIFDDYINLYNENIYIIQYPELFYKQKACVSYGLLMEIQDEYNIIHFSSTESGSSGSPILNILNNKVIGIHKETSKIYNFNIGTFLKYPIYEYLNNINIIKKEIKNNEIKNSEINNNEIKESIGKKSNEINNNELKNNELNNKIKNFEINDIELKNESKNEINIKLEIGKDDINKDIYFLDNTDGKYNIDGKEVEHYHDNLKELNELNTKLYINNIKYKYKKYINVKIEGIYKIKLKFNIKIKDCSFMFCECFNIKNLDLSYFDTKNVTNMSYMFYNISDIAKLNLSSFDIKNVTKMSHILYLPNNPATNRDDKQNMNYNYYMNTKSSKQFKIKTSFGNILLNSSNNDILKEGFFFDVNAWRNNNLRTKSEIKKYLKEVKSKVDPIIYKKFIQNITFLNAFKDKDKDLIINIIDKIRILFWEHEDLFLKFISIIK